MDFSVQGAVSYYGFVNKITEYKLFDEKWKIRAVYYEISMFDERYI